MNPRIDPLQKIDAHLRSLSLTDSTSVNWNDGKAIRDLSQRLNRGDNSVWVEFLDLLRANPDLERTIYKLLEDIDWPVCLTQTSCSTLPLIQRAHINRIVK